MDKYILDDYLGLKKNIEVKMFADGEIYQRILNEKQSKTALIISPTFPNINDNLIKIIFLAKKLSKEYEKINLLMPYFPYARQDKTFLKGEIESAFELVSILKELKISKIITVDCHFIKKQGEFNYKGLDILNLSARDLFLNHFKEILDDFEIVTPDLGSSYLVEDLGKKSMKKQRGEYKNGEIAYRKIKTQTADFEINSENIIILDDMIAGGGTMKNAAKILKEKGAKKIFCASTHGLFINDADKKLLSSNIEKILVTDSIKTPYSHIELKNIPQIFKLIK